jgi:hypothetical protein
MIAMAPGDKEPDTLKMARRYSWPLPVEELAAATLERSPDDGV